MNRKKIAKKNVLLLLLFIVLLANKSTQSGKRKVECNFEKSFYFTGRKKNYIVNL
jgi:hypothetical protein